MAALLQQDQDIKVKVTSESTSGLLQKLILLEKRTTELKLMQARGIANARSLICGSRRFECWIVAKNVCNGNTYSQQSNQRWIWHCQLV